jgi:hypothetical protein
MAYAFVDDISYRRSGSLIVNGKLLEHVPRLAICINLGEDKATMLFHCDVNWNVLGSAGGDDIAELKESAEKNYPGVRARWVDLNTRIEDALRYYDEASGNLKCSFCGRRPFELERLIQGNNAAVCGPCVEKFHDLLSEKNGSASG